MGVSRGGLLVLITVLFPVLLAQRRRSQAVIARLNRTRGEALGVADRYERLGVIG